MYGLGLHCIESPASYIPHTAWNVFTLTFPNYHTNPRRKLLLCINKGWRGPVSFPTKVMEWIGNKANSKFSTHAFYLPTVTELRGFLFLCASKPNENWTGICSKKSKNLSPMAHAGVTGELILKDLAPQWLPGDGLYGGKIINCGD